MSIFPNRLKTVRTLYIKKKRKKKAIVISRSNVEVSPGALRPMQCLGMCPLQETLCTSSVLVRHMESEHGMCPYTPCFYFDIGLWGGVGLNQWDNLTDVHTKMELRALHHTFSPRNSTFVWACLSKKNIIDGMLQDVRIWNKSVAFLRSEEHPALKSFLMVSFPTLPVSICLVIIGPK